MDIRAGLDLDVDVKIVSADEDMSQSKQRRLDNSDDTACSEQPFSIFLIFKYTR